MMSQQIKISSCSLLMPFDENLKLSNSCPFPSELENFIQTSAKKIIPLEDEFPNFEINCICLYAQTGLSKRLVEYCHSNSLVFARQNERQLLQSLFDILSSFSYNSTLQAIFSDLYHVTLNIISGKILFYENVQTLLDAFPQNISTDTFLENPSILKIARLLQQLKAEIKKHPIVKLVDQVALFLSREPRLSEKISDLKKNYLQEKLDLAFLCNEILSILTAYIVVKLDYLSPSDNETALRFQEQLQSWLKERKDIETYQQKTYHIIREVSRSVKKSTKTHTQNHTLDQLSILNYNGYLNDQILQFLAIHSQKNIALIKHDKEGQWIILHQPKYQENKKTCNISKIPFSLLLEQQLKPLQEIPLSETIFLLHADQYYLIACSETPLKDAISYPQKPKKPKKRKASEQADEATIAATAEIITKAFPSRKQQPTSCLPQKGQNTSSDITAVDQESIYEIPFLPSNTTESKENTNTPCGTDDDYPDKISFQKRYSDTSQVQPTKKFKVDSNYTLTPSQLDNIAKILEKFQSKPVSQPPLKIKTPPIKPPSSPKPDIPYDIFDNETSDVINLDDFGIDDDDDENEEGSSEE